MKIGNLYNLESVERFVRSGEQPGFKDAQAGVILARNLTQVDPRLYEKKYPELALMSAGISVDNSGGYALQIQSLRVLEKGDFTVSKDQDDNKGKITLSAEGSLLPVYPYGGHSIWTDDEIKEAELQGINLPSQFLSAHNKRYQRKLDEIGLIGLPGSTGLLNSSAFTADSAAGAIGTLTAQQMYDEISDLIVAQRNGVNNTPEYSANKVMMPVRVYNVLTATMLNTAAGAMTVLSALKANYPDVTFIATFRADTTGNGGSLATSAVVAFNANDEAMKLRVPVPLTIGEIVKPSSFEFRVDSKFRIAGLDVLESTAGRRLTGL